MNDITASSLSARSFWKLVRTYPLVVVASVLLVIAVILALLDKVAGGSLVAGLFVVVTLFHFLPQMEHFKAFGIEAKWAPKVREASLIEGELRSSLATLNEQIKEITAQKERLPRDTVPAIEKLNSTASLANSQIIALGQANSAIADAISKWPSVAAPLSPDFPGGPARKQ